MADKAAKEAAQSRSMNATPFKHKSLKTARVNLIKQTIKKEWNEDWKTAKGDARHLRPGMDNLGSVSVRSGPKRRTDIF